MRLSKFKKALEPLKKLSLSDWANTHRVLSRKSSSEPGKWRTSRAPYTSKIMDCLSANHKCQRIVLMFAAQTSKSEIGLNWIGYIMHHSPAPTLVVLPTLEVRKRWVRQRLQPMLQETPCLAEIFDAKKSREAGNSEEIKEFPGGMILIGGANSPASLSSMPIRYVLCDEVDRFPWEIGQEGDPLGLIDERTKTFPNRKTMLVSTPTIKDSSRIESEYLASNQQRYYIPCPHCKEHQVLQWRNFKYKIDEYKQPVSAWYVCEHCGGEFDDTHKTRFLKNGEWRAEFPERKIEGFALNGLYSPQGLGFTWLEIARQWVGVQGDQSRLKRFINTTLGETWEDQSNNIKPSDLLKRVEDRQFRQIPAGCLALTCGVDTQDEWLAITLLGWGEGKLYIIDWHQIHGDTTRQQVWDDLETYLNTRLTNSIGKKMRIDAAGIDIRGHRGEQVKQFVSRRTLQIPVFAVQGSTSRMGRAISASGSAQDKTKSGKTIKTGFAIWNVGTEHCKDYIFGTLASDGSADIDNRVIRFPSGLDNDYFNGLLSETFDPTKNKYIQKSGAAYKRNEPLDTFVYAWAIGHQKQIRIGMTGRGEPSPQFWQRRSEMLEQGAIVQNIAENAQEIEKKQEEEQKTGRFNIKALAKKR